jgi:CCR4-NOT transcriptional regulation complex NOT5 subunit
MKHARIGEAIKKSTRHFSQMASTSDEAQPTRAYFREFVDHIANLPNKEKMAQIGLEPSVLGMPRDNIAFSKAKSYFTDVPFDTSDTARVPKQWLEFANLPSPINVIPSMPELTLFFMFYTQPSDLIQIAAGEELHNRGWNYDEADWRWSKDIEGEQYDFDLHSWSLKGRNRARQ